MKFTSPDSPLVSLVTINYNQVGLTLDFLKSTRTLVYPNFEIIVVDNASEEDPTEVIAKDYPEVTVLRNEKNLGFAGGNNTGIRAARGEYIFLVNNDTEVTPRLVSELVSTFYEYENVGVVSPKFHYFFHPGTVEYAGYQKVHSVTGRNGMIGCREKDTGKYDTPQRTHYGHGGGMMIARKAIDDAGLMPEFYFLYYEEFDWCNTIKKHGYTIYYQPKALIHHKESMTTGKKSVLKTYYLTRNRILFMRRNECFLNYLSFLVYFIGLTIPKNTITFIIRREWTHLKAFYRGIFWNVTNPKLHLIDR